MTMRNGERAIQDLLHDLLCGDHGTYPDYDEVSGLETFADAGVLTSNGGLVVRLANGGEYQLTIVQSKLATDGSDDENTMP